MSKLSEHTLSVYSTYKTGLFQARAYRNLKNFMVETLSQYNLTSAEWSILGTIHDESKNGGIRVSDLAKQLDVQKSFVTNMVRNLIAQEYAVHRYNEDDNRVRLIYGTEKAHLKVVEIEQVLRREMKKLLKDVDSNDLLIYIKVLDQISNLTVRR